MNRYFASVLATLLFHAIALSGGCHYFYDRMGEQKRIPSPLIDSFPHEISGDLYQVWVGNELQIQTGLHTSYLILQGVDNPDGDARQEQAAVEHLNELIGDSKIRAVIVQYDNSKRAIAQVYAGETHLNLAMIESGWGRYDGSEFADSNRFEAAQSRASSEKLGMWASE